MAAAAQQRRLNKCPHSLAALRHYRGSGSRGSDGTVGTVGVGAPPGSDGGDRLGGLSGGTASGACCGVGVSGGSVAGNVGCGCSSVGPIERPGGSKFERCPRGAGGVGVGRFCRSEFCRCRFCAAS